MISNLWHTGCVKQLVARRGEAALVPGGSRLSQVADYMPPSPPTSPRRYRQGTDDWSSYTGVAGVTHLSSADAAHIVLPWAHRIFANLKVIGPARYHGLAASTSNRISMNSSSDSTAGAGHAAYRCLLRIAAAPPPCPARCCNQRNKAFRS